MLANILGVKRCSITYKETDDGWSFTIPEILDGRIEHEPGKERGEVVKVSNLKYWVAPEIIVCKGSKRSRIRDHGRIGISQVEVPNIVLLIGPDHNSYEK